MAQRHGSAADASNKSARSAPSIARLSDCNRLLGLNSHGTPDEGCKVTAFSTLMNHSMAIRADDCQIAKRDALLTIKSGQRLQVMHVRKPASNVAILESKIKTAAGDLAPERALLHGSRNLGAAETPLT